MSYTLSKLRAAREAIRQEDWETAGRCIDELIERMEKILKLQKHYSKEKEDVYHPMRQMQKESRTET